MSKNKSAELGGEHNGELNANTVKGAVVGAMVLGNVSVLVQALMDVTS